MRCEIRECQQAADPDGGTLCVEHQKWTAPLLRRSVQAIETAITEEDGLDGLVGEKLLRDLGYWPKRTPKDGQ